MNFFGIGGLEWLIIGTIAFFVLGPKSMVEGARAARKVIKNLREQGNELQTMFKEAASLEDERDAEDKAPPAPSGAVARPSGGRPATSQHEGRIANETRRQPDTSGVPVPPDDQEPDTGPAADKPQ